MEIILDGEKIKSKAKLYKVLKQQISYKLDGEDLDSLWSVLSSVDEEIIVRVVNSNVLSNNLKSYYNALMGLFARLSIESVSHSLIIE